MFQELGASLSAISMRSDCLVGLSKKVYEELKDPRQFADPERAKELLGNGLAHLRALRKKCHADTAEIEARLASTVTLHQQEQGLRLLLDPTLPLALVAFPKEAGIDYMRPDVFPREPQNAQFGIVGTTFRSGFPSQGYADAQGVSMPFIKRDQESAVQHGGLFYCSGDKSLTLLEYDEMIQRLSQPFSPEEVLIQSDWYVDSECCHQVSNRQNMLVPRPYNGIGVFRHREGNFYFTVNNELQSVHSLARAFGVDANFKKNYVTAKEIAAICNFAKKKFRATSWQFAGTEFNDGGTYWLKEVDRTPFAARDYFVISY